LRPDADRTLGYRVVAAITPLALWSTYFLILIFVYRSPWPFDLWLGTTLLAAISGLLLSYIAIPPALPESVSEAEAPLRDHVRAMRVGAMSGQGAVDLGRSSSVSSKATPRRGSRSSPHGRQRCRTQALASAWSTSSPSRAWTQRRDTHSDRPSRDLRVLNGL